jgi:hypothetical protein
MYKEVHFPNHANFQVHFPKKVRRTTTDYVQLASNSNRLPFCRNNNGIPPTCYGRGSSRHSHRGGGGGEAGKGITLQIQGQNSPQMQNSRKRTHLSKSS